MSSSGAGMHLLTRKSFWLFRCPVRDVLILWTKNCGHSNVKSPFVKALNFCRLIKIHLKDTVAKITGDKINTDRGEGERYEIYK